mmetsp:Transcript_25317/g.71422  ORF Transcript_25317/g.71422 Transcript_25317/m.71422 type:complete len:186 (-) Transcript_25317:302-859(-)
MAQLTTSQQLAAIAYARELASNAFNNVRELTLAVLDYVQRGPDGIGWFCFVGGLATCVYSTALCINIFAALLEPLTYMVNMYQAMYGAVTCLVESPLEWQANPKLARAQGFVHEFARFLTTHGGRGLFYLFQGSLALSLRGLYASYILAVYMIALGALRIAMQLGFKPTTPWDETPTNTHYVLVT